MKSNLTFLKNLIHSTNSSIVVSESNPPTESNKFRDFNYDEAVKGALFQLRNGKISLLKKLKR